MKECKNILYVSCLCSSKTEQEILKVYPQGIGIQVQKYHRLLAEGFYKNGIDVTSLSHHKGLNMLSSKRKTREKEHGIDYNYITKKKGGYLSILINSFYFAFKFFKKNKNSIMICDVLNFTVSLGAAIAAHIFRRPIIGIITDFPEQMSGKRNLQSWLIWRMISLCTGYVILTKQMREKLNRKKPSIILEGHVDSDMENKQNELSNKYDKKVCIYAGMIHRKYGIENLINAFCNLNCEDVELHIYGDGDYADNISKNTSKKIKYFGIKPNEQVVLEEIKATLLINPRPSNEEYTKYSFPSKNLEYMVSGTPLLTTKLPGMPEEYLRYVYVFNDETVEGMKNTLCSLLCSPKEELFDKGKEAKAFVLKNKNNVVQAKRIIDSMFV